jgi:nicotinamide-nucleotide amidase
MRSLIPMATKIGALLKARGDTLAVAESSAGGLISAALLAVPGASAYFLGGAVVYTVKSRLALLNLSKEALGTIRPSTEPYALLLARTMREHMDATWALSETGATGPTGNRYGDAAGHACLGIAGPVERAMTLETGSADREHNMRAFARRGLALLLEELERLHAPQ